MTSLDSRRKEGRKRHDIRSFDRSAGMRSKEQSGRHPFAVTSYDDYKDIMEHGYSDICTE